MLYLRNTNQIQTISQQVVRGGAGPLPPTPPDGPTYFDGLGRRTYLPGAVPTQTGWLSPQWFDTYGVQTGSATADSGALDVTFFNIDTGSVEWKGYFKASTSETYSFYLDADDQALLWIGDIATGSLPPTASALINVVTLASNRTGSIGLVSGSYYGMRVEYTGVVTGTDYFTASFSTPTISKTTNLTGYSYCNTASIGF